MEDQGKNGSYESGTQRSGLEIRICESSSQEKNMVLSVTLEFIGNGSSMSLFRKINMTVIYIMEEKDYQC